MLNKKISQDLEELLKIAKAQDNQINLSTILITTGNSTNLNKILEYFTNEGVRLLVSDVEPDVVDTTISSADIAPFDPTKIDIKMDKLSIQSIINRLENEEFDLNVDFQRKAGLWTNMQKSQLIESVLLKIPLPAFYFDASNEDRYLIIDGLQRITTIKQFVIDKTLALSGMEFLKELNGLTFDKLPRSLQRRIEETNINAYLISPSTPENVKFNIFKRINTGGLTLEPQEIRNALYQGSATIFIKELAKEPVFLKATDYGIKSDRMADREFCLRYIAFTQLDIDDYTGIADDFLNSAMVYLNKAQSKTLEDIRKTFRRDIQACYDILGKHTFRKMGNDQRRRPINKVLFETWLHVINTLSDDQINMLIHKKQQVVVSYICLCEKNQIFISAVKASDKSSLKRRISEIRRLLNTVIKGEEYYA